MHDKSKEIIKGKETIRIERKLKQKATPSCAKFKSEEKVIKDNN